MRISREILVAGALAFVLLATSSMAAAAVAIHAQIEAPKESVQRPSEPRAATLVEKYDCTLTPEAEGYDAKHAVVRIDGRVRYVGPRVVEDIVFGDFPHSDVFGFCR